MDLFLATAQLDLPLESALKALRAEGYRHLCASGDAERLRQASRQGPLPALHLVDPRYNLASDDRFRAEFSFKSASEAIRLAGDAGEGWVSLSPGFALYGGLTGSGEPDSEPVDRAKAKLRLLRALDRLANDADNHAVRLSLRLQASEGRDELMALPEDAHLLLTTLGAPHVRLGLDLGHIKVSSHRDRRDPDELVEACLPIADRIWLHGNEGRHDDHARPKVGSWELSQLDRQALQAFPVVYDAYRQPLTEIHALVQSLISQGYSA